MKCRGKFKFKELRKVDGGSFINANGQSINYNSSYKLKLDEKVEDYGIQERTFKIADNESNTKLIKELSEYKEYSDIILDFDVVISSNNSIRIVPLAIVATTKG